MRYVGQIEIQRLCEHGDLTTFACDDPDYENELPMLRNRFARGEDIAVFLAFDSAETILGYAGVAEASLYFTSAKQAIPYLSIPTFAVSATAGPSVVMKLMEVVEQAIGARRRAKPEVEFHGILCLPKPTNRRLTVFLKRRMKFDPVPGQPSLLWRPFQTREGA